MMASLLQRQQIIVFTVTWLSYAILYFLRKPIGVIKPSLEDEFKISKTQLGFMDVALLLPYALVQISGGSLGDRFGPRLTISLCLTIAGTAMVTFGIWNNYWMLLFAMFVNGAMQGPVWPSCCKAVCSWYPDSKINSIVGFLSTSVFVGGALGTALAVHIQSVYGWRMVHIPPALMAVAFGLLVFCLLQTPEEKHITIPGKESSLPTKIVGGEDSFRNKSSLWSLWKIPAVFEIAMTVLCLKVVRYCMIFWLPMYLIHALQYSVVQAGMFSTIFDIGGSLGSPVIGLILDKKFKKNTLFGMWIFVSISCMSMALFSWTSRWGFVQNAIFMFLAGATNGGTDALLAGSVSMKIGEANGMRLGASVTGLINGVGTFGAVLEGPFVGYISDLYGWDAMLTMIIILSTISSFMVFKAMRIQKRVDTLNDSLPLLT